MAVELMPMMEASGRAEGCVDGRDLQAEHMFLSRFFSANLVKSVAT